jgi:hypothetical protein
MLVFVKLAVVFLELEYSSRDRGPWRKVFPQYQPCPRVFPETLRADLRAALASLQSASVLLGVQRQCVFSQVKGDSDVFRTLKGSVEFDARQPFQLLRGGDVL